jgi:hypothetical protein
VAHAYIKQTLTIHEQRQDVRATYFRELGRRRGIIECPHILLASSITEEDVNDASVGCPQAEMVKFHSSDWRAIGGRHDAQGCRASVVTGPLESMKGPRSGKGEAADGAGLKQVV